MKVMRTAIYIRVSTKLQEKKYSLKAQKEELTRYAVQQGWEITDYFKDVETGGTLNKDGLNELIDHIEEEKCDVVLCINQDRLSRLDTISWEFLKDVLRENNVKIAEPGNLTDLANEDDEFISDIKNLIARREKRTIVKRMMYGKRQRTREGKGWGKTFLEYIPDGKGGYLINEEWAWTIPFIDDLYVNKKLSDRKIAEILTKKAKKPSGKVWSVGDVMNRLTSRAFHGDLVKDFKKFKEETIVVEEVFPPLRTKEMWEKIQRERKKRHRRKPMVYPHLLREVEITCEKCKKKLSMHQSGSKRYGIRYYLKHSYKLSNCDTSIWDGRFEENLITAIQNILESEEMAKNYIQLEYNEEEMIRLKKEIKQMKTQKQKLNEKLDKLLELYLDDMFDKKTLQQKKNHYTVQLEVLSKNIIQKENKIKLIEEKQFNYDMVYEYLSIIENFDLELTIEEQMDMIGVLFPTGKLTSDEKYLLLNGTLQNNIPLEIKIPVNPNPFKPIKREKYDRFEKYKEIEQLFQQHPMTPQIEIAKMAGVAPSTIHRLKERFGPYKNYTPIIQQNPKERIEEIKELIKKDPKITGNQISKITGIPKNTVYRLMRNHNLRGE